jgi:hypothetical protein
MDGFVLDLFLSSGHEVADTSLSVFSPVGFDVGEFHTKKFTIEAGEEGHEEVLLAFHPEIVVSVVESPGVSTAFSEHEEIFSACDKAKGD